eukprot:TRINITY_DN3220_c0_g1_i3.p1 TRINITY_DN3220_c0_g1~~TRINITY_DN3220_c0_g1_i3.p1  ORF type:complete len:1197 (-),score=186.40 TRINITY_DN3220_c0_g1_i3:18-3329(-)
MRDMEQRLLTAEQRAERQRQESTSLRQQISELTAELQQRAQIEVEHALAEATLQEKTSDVAMLQEHKRTLEEQLEVVRADLALLRSQHEALIQRYETTADDNRRFITYILQSERKQQQFSSPLGVPDANRSTSEFSSPQPAPVALDLSTTSSDVDKPPWGLELRVQSAELHTVQLQQRLTELVARFLEHAQSTGAGSADGTVVSLAQTLASTIDVVGRERDRLHQAEAEILQIGQQLVEVQERCTAAENVAENLRQELNWRSHSGRPCDTGCDPNEPPALRLASGEESGASELQDLLEQLKLERLTRKEIEAQVKSLRQRLTDSEVLRRSTEAELQPLHMAVVRLQSELDASRHEIETEIEYRLREEARCEQLTQRLHTTQLALETARTRVSECEQLRCADHLRCEEMLEHLQAMQSEVEEALRRCCEQENLRKQIEQKYERLSERMQRIKAERDEAAKTRQECIDDVIRLQADLEQQNGEVMLLREDANKWKRECENFSHQLAVLTAELQQITVSRDSLHQEHRVAVQDREHFRSLSAKLEGEVTALRIETEASARQVRELHVELSAAKSAAGLNSTLKSELELLRQLLSDERQARKVVDGQRAALETTTCVSKEEIAILEGQLQRVIQERDYARQELEVLLHRQAAESPQKAAHKSEPEWQLDVERTENERNHWKRAFERISLELQETISQLEAKRAEIEQQTKARRELEQKLLTFQDSTLQVESLKTRLETLNRELKELEIERDLLSQALQDTRSSRQYPEGSPSTGKEIIEDPSEVALENSPIPRASFPLVMNDEDEQPSPRAPQPVPLGRTSPVLEVDPGILLRALPPLNSNSPAKEPRNRVPPSTSSSPIAAGKARSSEIHDRLANEQLRKNRNADASGTSAARLNLPSFGIELIETESGECRAHATWGPARSAGIVARDLIRGVNQMRATAFVSVSRLLQDVDFMIPITLLVERNGQQLPLVVSPAGVVCSPLRKQSIGEVNKPPPAPTGSPAKSPSRRTIGDVLQRMAGQSSPPVTSPARVAGSTHDPISSFLNANSIRSVPARKQAALPPPDSEQDEPPAQFTIPQLFDDSTLSDSVSGEAWVVPTDSNTAHQW